MGPGLFTTYTVSVIAHPPGMVYVMKLAPTATPETTPDVGRTVAMDG